MRAVLFTSKSCKSCPAMKETLKKTKIEYDEIDIGLPRGQNLAQKYYIKSLPTLIIFDEAVPIKTYIGAIPFSKVIEIKKKYL
jgi:glutaredoxin-related protein